MKRTLLFLSFSLFAASIVKAQSGFQLGGGAHLGVTTTGGSGQFVIGGELQGEYKFSEKASFISTAAYSHFLITGGGFGAMPVVVGARVYPAEKFFIGAQIGYGFFTGIDGGGGFAYRPGVGYDTGNMQVALNYNGISNMGSFSWLTLSTVFKFGGK